MMHLERVPYIGDHFESNGLCFEVIDMDDNRVDKVLVVPLNMKHQEWIDRKHQPNMTCSEPRGSALGTHCPQHAELRCTRR